MGYDIPDKIKYKEKIVFGLDGRQLIYALAFGFAALLAYGLPISGEGKFVLPGFIVIVGAGFIFFRLEDKAIEHYSYFQAKQLKKDMKKFADTVIQIGKIENNYMILRNKEFRAILQVTPLNFALFDDDRKKALIGNYRDFLNHLTYPVQIVVRTKRADLAGYYADYEERAKRLKGGLKALYKDFKKHETDFLMKNSVNEREYYLIVCLRPESKNLEESVKRLNERTLIAQEKLLECGIESRRLTGGEILPFAVSYFNEVKHETETNEKRKAKGTKKAKQKKAGRAGAKKAGKRKKATNRKKARR